MHLMEVSTDKPPQVLKSVEVKDHGLSEIAENLPACPRRGLAKSVHPI